MNRLEQARINVRDAARRATPLVLTVAVVEVLDLRVAGAPRWWSAGRAVGVGDLAVGARAARFLAFAVLVAAGGASRGEHHLDDVGESCGLSLS